MYLDQLDTVRFNVENQNIDNNCLLAETAIMKNIIEGNTITLSQSQLFDSGIILKLLENSAFINLFEKHIINVALFHKDLEQPDVKSFKDIVISKLKQGIDDDKPYFYFSGIDSLSNEKIYSDNSKQNKDIPRKMAIEILQTNGKSITDYPYQHKDYFENLKNFADVINLISEPITKCDIRTTPTKNCLSDLINGHLEKSNKKSEYYERNYIQTLELVFNKVLSEKRENMRSAYYSWVDDNDICEKEVAEKIKCIVDFYYNFIVGESVAQDNDELRELTFNNKILDNIDKNILFEVCKECGKYRILSEIEYSEIDYALTEELEADIQDNIITWDIINNLPNLPRNTHTRKVYDNFVINLSTPYQKQKKHSVLCKTVPAVITGVTAIAQGEFNPYEIFNIYSFVSGITTASDKLLENILAESKVNEAKARQIIYKIKERALLLKGGK